MRQKLAFKLLAVFLGIEVLLVLAMAWIFLAPLRRLQYQGLEVRAQATAKALALGSARAVQENDKSLLEAWTSNAMEMGGVIYVELLNASGERLTSRGSPVPMTPLENQNMRQPISRTTPGGELEVTCPIPAASINPQSAEFQQRPMGLMRMVFSRQGIQRELGVAILSAVLWALLILAGGLFLAQRVFGQLVEQPLGSIQASLKDWASGSGDLSKRIQISTQDEFGKMGQYLNQFLDQLTDMLRQILAVSRQMENSASSLSEITQQSAVNVSQFVQVMSQISKSTGQVAQNSQLSATSVQHAGATAQEGGRMAVQVVEMMNATQSAVSAAAGYIHELGKRSNQIGKIVDVITKITDQTNLLSLNAAIEAARAGESGRGFAVVADEIRKLAESSADSAKQITDLIGEVQDETRRAIAATEKGTKEVTDGYKLVQEAGKLFSSIANEVTEMTQQISQTASITEEVASSTEEATASSEEEAAAIQQMATHSQDLSQIVGQLRNLASRFRIEENGQPAEKKAKG